MPLNSSTTFTSDIRTRPDLTPHNDELQNSKFLLPIYYIIVSDPTSTPSTPSISSVSDTSNSSASSDQAGKRGAVSSSFLTSSTSNSNSPSPGSLYTSSESQSPPKAPPGGRCKDDRRCGSIGNAANLS
jgi:hypothetical protein